MSVNLLNVNNKLVEENTKKTTVQNEQSIIPYLQSYEKRMNEYMDSIPHIPPTQFELKVRHGDVKNEIIKQFKKRSHWRYQVSGQQATRKPDRKDLPELVQEEHGGVQDVSMRFYHWLEVQCQ